MAKNAKGSTRGKTKARAASGKSRRSPSGSAGARGRLARQSPAATSTSRGGRSASVSSRKAGQEGKASQDALDLLKSQHREVESLFKQFDRAENDNECFEIAQLVCHKLTVHATIEEEMFYPRARSSGEQGGSEEDSGLKDLVLEALEEHLSAKRLIADIQAIQVGDERLEAKMTVLKEQVMHHVEEEEGELFPNAKKEISKDERQVLAQQLLQRATELEEASDATMDARDERQDRAEAGQTDGAMDSGAQRGGSQRSGRSAGSHAHH